MNLSFTNSNNIVSKFDPRARILAYIVFLSSILLANFYLLSVVLLPLLCLLLLLFSKNPRTIIFSVLKIFPMIFLITIVQIFNGLPTESPIIQSPIEVFKSGLELFLLTNFKFILIAVTSLYFLSVTPVNEIIQVMKRANFPSAFISVFFFTERFFHQILKDAKKKFIAFKSRYLSLGFLAKVKYAGILTVTICIEIIEKSERIYFSLSSRSFSGILPAENCLTWKLKDSLLVTGITLLPIIIIGFQ